MKSIRSFLTAAALFCAAVLFVGCGKSEKTVAPVKKAIPELHMATEATFPPYEYFENGKVVGIDVDIVSYICSELGYKLVIDDMKFDSVILSVQSHKADIGASGITVTEERKKQINFTIPYVTAAQVIIVPKNSDIKKPQDLKGKRLGVQQGSTGDTYVTKNIQEPLRFDNGALAVAALRAKKLDAVILDNEPSRVHVAAHPEDVTILPEILTSEEYAFALAKDKKNLLSSFNKVIRQMRKNGKLQAILDKYLNNDRK